MPETPSPNYGLIAVSDGDAIEDYPVNDQAKVAALDDLLTPAGFGARASRPRSTVGPVGIAGRHYVSNDGGIDMDTGTAWITVKPGLFTSLPTLSGHASDGLDEGMEIYYQTAAMATAVVGPWRLRYNSALSGTSKWVAVGDGSWFEQVAASESTSSASLVDLATVGPSVTSPVAGVYVVEVGALMSGGPVASLNGSAAVSGIVLCRCSLSDTSGTSHGTPSAAGRATVTAGQLLKLQYASPAGGSIAFSQRWLKVTPQRLG